MAGLCSSASYASFFLLISLLVLPMGLSSGQTLTSFATELQPYLIVVNFAEGITAANIGNRILPTCLLLSGPGQLVLEKDDGSLEIGRTVGTGGTLFYTFNTTEHPVITKRYQGTYRCRAVQDGRSTISAESYQLNVIVPLVPNTVPKNPTVYDITAGSQSLVCGVTAFGPMTISWTSNIVLQPNTTDRVPPYSATGNHERNVSSTISFNGNLSSITAGVAFNVTCMAYNTPVVCTTGSSEKVLRACHTALKPFYSTTSVTFQVTHCRQLSGKALGFHDIPRTSVGVSLPVTCQAGYTASVSMATCQADGQWTTGPYCKDIDECEEDVHNCHKSTCVNRSPGFTCSCTDTQNCTYTECKALNITGVNLIPTTNVRPADPLKVSVVCLSGFSKPKPAEITCRRDGTFSDVPVCTATSTAATPTAATSADSTLISSEISVIAVGAAGGGLTVFIIIIIIIILVLRKRRNGGVFFLGGNSGSFAGDGGQPDAHALVTLISSRPSGRLPIPPNGNIGQYSNNSGPNHASETPAGAPDGAPDGALDGGPAGAPDRAVDGGPDAASSTGHAFVGGNTSAPTGPAMTPTDPAYSHIGA